MMDYARRVDHMPTAKAADTATRSVIDEGRSGHPPTKNSLKRSRTRVYFTGKILHLAGMVPLGD